MHRVVVQLSIPGLRTQDLSSMPNLGRLVAGGGYCLLVPSFPALTCPVQANMTTGTLPREHGVVANGFYWRDQQRVEMWTAWNDCIQRPQIWDLLHQHDRSLTSAVWFGLHSKGCGADYICTPAPIHNPDGSESLWCHTRPDTLYTELLHELGHFPLDRFWGPLAGVESSAWIIDSALIAAKKYRPNYFSIYLPHLDYAAQKSGPNSRAAKKALSELDAEIAKLGPGFGAAYDEQPLWLVSSEYAIVPVDDVVYPNRVLREAGLLALRDSDQGQLIDFAASKAWALADHQMSHVFVQNADPTVIKRIATLFKKQPGIAEVLTGEGLERYGLDHPRSGEVVLVSAPNSWQAYYWWLDNAQAPAFARKVDIHRKPGYDPVELCLDRRKKSIPLDARLVKGSHGAPANDPSQQGILLASAAGVIDAMTSRDVDLAKIVLRQFEVE